MLNRDTGTTMYYSHMLTCWFSPFFVKSTGLSYSSCGLTMDSTYGKSTPPFRLFSCFSVNSRKKFPLFVIVIVELNCLIQHCRRKSSCEAELGANPSFRETLISVAFLDS